MASGASLAPACKTDSTPAGVHCFTGDTLDPGGENIVQLGLPAGSEYVCAQNNFSAFPYDCASVAAFLDMLPVEERDETRHHYTERCCDLCGPDVDPVPVEVGAEAPMDGIYFGPVEGCLPPVGCHVAAGAIAPAEGVFCVGEE